MAAEVQKKFGRCDILINCAGIYPQQDFDEMTFEDWRRVLSINLDSVFLVSVGLRARHEAARLGPHRQHGVEHARLGGDRLRALHVEQGRHRRLHAGAGERARPARHHRQRDLAGPDAVARHAGAQAARPASPTWTTEFNVAASMQAIKRVEVPDDLVGTVSYLTSDDAAFITGQTLNVDGGRVRS